MIVLDTSALVEVLTGESPDPDLVGRVATAGELHAPHLIDYEFIAVLRRLVDANLLDANRAADARNDLADIVLFRYALAPELAERVWELRHSIGTYDAAFVVLAEALVLPIITTDERLTRAHGHRAVVEAYPAHSNP